MRIAMFVIFLIADLIVLLACKFKAYIFHQVKLQTQKYKKSVKRVVKTGKSFIGFILLRELESVSFAFLILNYLQLYG